ncbi:nitrile hydratase subunit beta [Agrobacterium rhizogenes]|uniref:hypothetical protein n=1 Tax=Rhizobium rhizogenes TaxID=359 RepID=UPI0015742689|nr:hypothetical protein [Rhizobium rhizogenes]NTG85823.1 nitrile hydratase subunit beta [Rhizobium rhizogenes]
MGTETKKFKVGDRVRRINEAFGDMSVGDVGVVESSDYASTNIVGDGHNYITSNFELVEPKWQPKVGDRVRVVDNSTPGGSPILRYKVGQEYTVTSICKDASGNDAFMLLDHYQYLRLDQITKPTALTISAGKFYETRDGRKVGPMEKMWDGKFNGRGAVVKRADGTNTDNPQRYFANGSVFMKRSGEEADELVAEWVDEPAVAPAKPKFKVGDRVKFRDDYGSSARGKKATVVNVSAWGVQVDVGGSYGVSTESPDSLVLLSEPSAIIALIEGGQPKPATRPKIHIDQISAAKEAERLALLYPGQEFGVFVLAESKVADVVEETVKRTVLRAA